MAGYNGFSMSNNAVEAYRKGIVPASKIPGIPAELVRTYCRPVEWHHSSKFYNRVDFYSRAEVRATFGLEQNESYPVDEQAVRALAAYKASTLSRPKIVENCRVEWLEWGGTRKHPKAIERRADNCVVSIKGVTATVTLPDGQILVKRIATNGFAFHPASK